MEITDHHTIKLSRPRNEIHAPHSPHPHNAFHGVVATSPAAGDAAKENEVPSFYSATQSTTQIHTISALDHRHPVGQSQRVGGGP